MPFGWRETYADVLRRGDQRATDRGDCSRGNPNARDPPGYHAQIGTLLGEAPLGLLVKAVEESAQREGVTPKKIWGHVYQWVKELQITRPALNE